MDAHPLLPHTYTSVDMLQWSVAALGYLRERGTAGREGGTRKEGGEEGQSRNEVTIMKRKPDYLSHTWDPCEILSPILTSMCIISLVTRIYFRALDSWDHVLGILLPLPSKERGIHLSSWLDASMLSGKHLKCSHTDNSDSDSLFIIASLSYVLLHDYCPGFQYGIVPNVPNLWGRDHHCHFMEKETVAPFKRHSVA